VVRQFAGVRIRALLGEFDGFIDFRIDLAGRLGYSGIIEQALITQF
jgi:hypothetical protein